MPYGKKLTHLSITTFLSIPFTSGFSLRKYRIALYLLFKGANIQVAAADTAIVHIGEIDMVSKDIDRLRTPE